MNKGQLIQNVFTIRTGNLFHTPPERGKKSKNYTLIVQLINPVTEKITQNY